MKKILFFLFLLIFIIYIFIPRDKLINKHILNTNLDINYPYLYKYNINNYIKYYINRNINNNKDKLIIDYDYDDINNIIRFYKTKINNNIINYKLDSYKITNNSFIRINNIEKVNEYDFYNNKYINNKKYIAFTFDDGPSYNTSYILDILKKYNVTATFFLVGKNIINNESIVKKMSNYNMEIANHTYSHKLLDNYKILEKEINITNNLIYNITGSYPKLFRPCYGIYNNRIKNNINMPIILWNIDTLDWKYRNSNNISKIILDNVKDGDIILMHDLYKSTLNSLNIVIPRLLEQGYNIVSVSELFYYKNKNYNNSKVYRFVK